MSDMLAETKPPKVSILICCYNHGHYITEALLSILHQTYTSYECIVYNDGSTDDTDQKVECLMANYPDRSIRLISQPNGGIITARNAVAAQAHGEYYLYLDADDAIHPRFLEETAAVLDSMSTVGFVYTDVQHIGYRNDIWSGGPFNPRKMLVENQMTCTSLMRKKMFEDVGGFKEVMRRGYEDWEFWLAGIEAGWAGHHVAKPYFYYRKDSTESRLHTVDQALDRELRTKMIELHPELYKNLG